MNARYSGNWYYAWLIERRDHSQPLYWTVGCDWTLDPHEALWFARESDAQADAGECPHDVKVVEHGFMLERERTYEGRDDDVRGVLA